MTEAVFKATIHGLRTVPSRGVLQVTIEAPIEHLQHVAAIAEHGKWVAVARIAAAPVAAVPAQKQRRPFDSLHYASQAGIRCNDPVYRAFLREMCAKEAASAAQARTPEQAAVAIHDLCKVASRGHITPGTDAEQKWLELERWFSAWQTKERAMA